MPMPPTRAAARALAACLGALACLGVQAAPAQAQEQPPSDNVDAQDSFYCQERKLGYWFYCTRPKLPEQTAPAAAPSATNQLDAITATLRELKAKAILEPTPANVTAYIRFQREQLDRASLFSDVWQRAISTDGGPSRHFQGYTVETNQRTRMGLEPRITPAVVLWDALKNQPIPIGYGVMSADELQDRIFLLTSKEAGRDY